eukprot:TRINITY_DN3953_c1_g1_i1.p1 TRINITY_DN3953_c1_g1~~TRINITY_DN3953_c1_g1_i1.p1  ORF type:complete len:174 (-),score=61.21 TRINITY_DN3953_c1_g1_i1:29-514(-)
MSTKDRKVINFYRERDEFGEFSNFAKYPITIDDQEWPTTEHYFQAMKFPESTEYQELMRTTKSCSDVKKMGQSRNHKLREDWEEVKDDIMFDCCLVKFTQYPQLKKLLKSTGEAKLVEHTRNDKYWGDGGDGSGKNMLGITLMKVRDALNKKETDDDEQEE